MNPKTLIKEPDYNNNNHEKIFAWDIEERFPGSLNCVKPAVGNMIKCFLGKPPYFYAKRFFVFYFPRFYCADAK